MLLLKWRSDNFPSYFYFNFEGFRAEDIEAVMEG